MRLGKRKVLNRKLVPPASNPKDHQRQEVEKVTRRGQDREFLFWESTRRTSLLKWGSGGGECEGKRNRIHVILNGQGREGGSRRLDGYNSLRSVS